jgi:hypothetical protein
VERRPLYTGRSFQWRGITLKERFPERGQRVATWACSDGSPVAFYGEGHGWIATLGGSLDSGDPVATAEEALELALDTAKGNGWELSRFVSAPPKRSARAGQWGAEGVSSGA